MATMDTLSAGSITSSALAFSLLLALALEPGFRVLPDDLDLLLRWRTRSLSLSFSRSRSLLFWLLCSPSRSPSFLYRRDDVSEECDISGILGIVDMGAVGALLLCNSTDSGIG